MKTLKQLVAKNESLAAELDRIQKKKQECDAALQKQVASLDIDDDEGQRAMTALRNKSEICSHRIPQLEVQLAELDEAIVKQLDTAVLEVHPIANKMEAKERAKLKSAVSGLLRPETAPHTIDGLVDELFPATVVGYQVGSINSTISHVLYHSKSTEVPVSRAKRLINDFEEFERRK